MFLRNRTRLYKPVIFLLCVSILFLSTVSCLQARTLGSDSGNKEALLTNEQRKKLRKLDTEIILECLKLARFNIDFHETANKHWAWRSVLYPLAKQTGTALSFANVVSDMYQRGRSFRNPSKRSNAVRRRGLFTTATGKVIGGTGSALELTQNGIVCLIAKKKGFSPKKSLDFVLHSRSEINRMLEQRDILIESLRDGQSKELLKLESLLLRRIKNRLIREFKRWSALSREQMWKENVFFALDVSQESVNFSNNILSLGTASRPSNSQTASILGLVAKSISTLNPLIRTATGKFVSKYQRWRLDRALPEEEIPNAEKLLSPYGDIDELMALAKSKDPSERQIEEFDLLVNGSLKVDAFVDRERAKIEKLRRVAQQQAISGPLIGLSSLAQKVLVVVSEYGDGDTNTNNQLRFAGRISQAAGQGYSLVNTPTTQVLHYLKNKDLRKQGKLPSQILERRKKRIEKVEKQVRAWIVN